MRTEAFVLASIVLAGVSTMSVPLSHAQPKGAAPAPAVLPPPATFEILASTAGSITRADLLGLAWASAAPCTDGDDSEQRLCRAVRDRRMTTLRAGTWLVDGDSGALTVGEWSAADKLVTVSVAGCVACVEPPGGLYVVSSATAPTFTGAVAQGATIHTSSLTLPDAVVARRFRTRAPALRTQFVVKVAAAAGGLWAQGDKRGLAVDILAMRVYDPCDGNIVVSSAPSGQGPVDATTCPAADKVPVRTDRPQRELPTALTSKDIRAAMAPVEAAASECYDAYGVMGKVKLTYTVGGDGAVSAYEQQGDFIDTPTGTCIDKAARAVVFPKTQKRSFTFTYPISVP